LLFSKEEGLIRPLII